MDYRHQSALGFLKVTRGTLGDERRGWQEPLPRDISNLA